MSSVKDLKLSANSSVLEVLKSMSQMGGFMGPNLATALDILVEMMKERDCLRVLTFTGNLVATGLRGIIADALRRRLFDLVVTTCGALDHDISRSRSGYLQGSFDVDDVRLREEGLHRLGNVFIPIKSYGELIEREVAELLRSSEEGKTFSTYELCWALGEQLGSESSILYWAWRNRIPVVVPSVYDGAVGYNIWMRGRAKRVSVDIARDQDLLNELMWSNKVKGALILGGGVSKHHALWWAQFGGDGFDYAVYLNSTDEYDGSLSGARPKEAITWGKVGPRSKNVFVKTDVTLVLPFLYVGLLSLLSDESSGSIRNT